MNLSLKKNTKSLLQILHFLLFVIFRKGCDYLPKYLVHKKYIHCSYHYHVCCRYHTALFIKKLFNIHRKDQRNHRKKVMQRLLLLVYAC